MRYYFLLILLQSTLALANHRLTCVDSNGKIAAQINIPEASQMEERTEQSCNGGVGDPIICQQVTYVYEHKLVDLKLLNLNPPLSLEIRAVRMVSPALDSLRIDNWSFQDTELGQDGHSWLSLTSSACWPGGIIQMLIFEQPSGGVWAFACNENRGP